MELELGFVAALDVGLAVRALQRNMSVIGLLRR